MIRDFKLLLLGSCCLAVTACAAPNREPDLSNIKSNVDQTREGDFGDFLYNLVEAEDKARLEAELKGKLEEERKAREDAERRAREVAEQTRREIEEKAKRDAEELRQRLEAEMKAKLEEERRKHEEEDRKRREEDERRRKEEDERRAKEDAERRAREEADQKRREEEDRRRKEEDERRAKDDAERRAREEAERRAKEEADKKRREEEEQKRRAEEEARRKADEERRAKEDAERKARDDAERRAKEEADRKRREEEEQKRRAEEEARRKADEERRAKEDAERKAKDDAERRAKEEAERRNREESERKAKEEAERKAKEEAEAKARAAQTTSSPTIKPVPPPPAPPPAGDIGDSLLADLDSFTQREDEEAKLKEEAEREAKEEAARKAKAEAERKAKDEAERRAKEEADRKRREEEERRAKEEAERKAKEEEEQRKQEEAERKRKAKEALAAKQAEEKAKAAAAAQRAGAAVAAKSAAKKKIADDDDIDVSDDDIDMDDIKRDEKVLAKTARKAALEQPSVASVTAQRPKKWGKPVAIALFVLLIGALGLLQVMPISTAEYEKAASEAMGAPVKIGSAHLSVITGIEVRFEGVSVGDAVKIGLVRGFPEVGSLFGEKKAFSRIELEKVSVSQSQLADAVLGKIAGDSFRVGRVVIKQARLDGPLALPPMDIEATVSGDGSLQSVKLNGGDKLSVQLSPKGNEIGFEISAGSLALPFVPALTLLDFSMKGTANRQGVTTSEFDGRAYDGVISGTAKIRWGATWSVDGELRSRAVKVAVFAPALVSEGKVEGRAAYSMSGATPASLYESARIQGEFKIEQGVLGSFDLTRALQTGGAQTSGRTIFSELTGQGVYDKGAIQIRNASITAGAMNAGASLDVDAGGALSGRVVADVKTPNQTLRATLNISGKVQDPVIRK